MFIGVHMPSYLKDFGMAPQVASYSLALIRLFDLFGTYIAGNLGQQLPKQYLLSGIYGLRALATVLFLLAPLSPWSVYAYAAVIGVFMAFDCAADQWHLGADFWRAAFVHAGRHHLL